jgi:hypothetical protein
MKHLIAIAMIVLASPVDAVAQAPGSAQTVKLPVARRFYDEGVDAADKGQWSIAHDRFKASYELVPRVQTLFNLASAQSQTGRLVEATESYRRFLRETTGMHFDLRAQATAQLELVEKQLAQITLDIVNLEPGDALALDDVELPHAVVRQAIPINPGTHAVRLQRGASVIATRAITLSSGAVESLRIELPVRAILEPPAKPLEPALEPDEPRPLALVDVPPASPAPRRRSWLRSPWLWSAVAVALAGGAAGAYVLSRPEGVYIH